MGKECVVIFDDGDGWWIARLLRLKITGTIGLRLLAAEDGKLDLNRSIDDLRSVGFRLSKKEYEKIISGAMD